jgi:hypothetical protein
MKTETKITVQMVELEKCELKIQQHQTELDHFIDLRTQMLKNLKHLKGQLESEIEELSAV